MMRFSTSILSIAVIMSAQAMAQEAADVQSADIVETQQIQVPTQKVVIMNNQPQSTQTAVQTPQTTNTGVVTAPVQVQQQPTISVEAAPLTDSSADRLRKSRQDLEVATEQKLVEKLEESRIQDEKARIDRVFGNKLDNPVQQPAVTQPVAPVAQPAAQVPVVIVAPEKKEEPKAEEVTKQDLQQQTNEIVGAIKDVKKEEPKPEKNKTYVVGLLGLGEYPDVVNIRGNYSTGFSIGAEMPNRVAFEGSFIYGNYDIEDVYWSDYSYWNSYYYPLFREMDQYNFQAAVKYMILPAALRPYVGAVLSYTYREYADTGYPTSFSGDNSATSNAIDVGALVGVDLKLSETMSIGADFRYMTNMTYRTNSSVLKSFVYDDVENPVEDQDYYTFMVTGRLTF